MKKTNVPPQRKSVTSSQINNTGSDRATSSNFKLKTQEKLPTENKKDRTLVEIGRLVNDYKISSIKRDGLMSSQLSKDPNTNYQFSQRNTQMNMSYSSSANNYNNINNQTQKSGSDIYRSTVPMANTGFAPNENNNF